MPDKKVVVYSSYGCPACNQVKEFLAKNGIAFTERNIIDDETALDELSHLGVLSTPVTLIDGEVVTGYNRKKIEQLLGR